MFSAVGIRWCVNREECSRWSKALQLVLQLFLLKFLNYASKSRLTYESLNWQLSHLAPTRNLFTLLPTTFSFPVLEATYNIAHHLQDRLLKTPNFPFAIFSCVVLSLVCQVTNITGSNKFDLQRRAKWLFIPRVRIVINSLWTTRHNPNWPLEIKNCISTDFQYLL